MSAQDNYEDLTECALTPELEHQLVYGHGECVFMWVNSKNEPFGVVMSYLPKDGKLWLTAAETRKRIPALRRNPRASICINSTGTRMGGGKTVTYKGTCVIQGLVLPRVRQPSASGQSGRRTGLSEVPRLAAPRDHGIRSRLLAELRRDAHVGSFPRSRSVNLSSRINPAPTNTP